MTNYTKKSERDAYKNYMGGRLTKDEDELISACDTLEGVLEPLKSRVQDIITENDPENLVVKQLVGMWHELYGDTLP